jgi:hypothetical protein
MNASDVLKYGDYTLKQTLKDFPEDSWETSGACGWWSVKNILAHLASYELMLIDVLNSLIDANAEIPVLMRMGADPLAFNDDEVNARKDMNVLDILDEYENAHRQTLHLIDRIPVADRRAPGALAWYGDEYDLEDFIVYTFYGHKREHSAQIAAFRDLLAKEK